MKLFILPAFIFMLPACSNRQTDVYDERDYILLKADTDKNIISRRTYVYKYDTARKFQIDYWDNGNMLAKGFSYHGKMDGKFEMYQMDGKLMHTDSFNNGVRISSKDFVPLDTPVKIFRKGKLEPFTSIDSLK